MMNVDIGNYNNNYVDSHKGKNSHSKNMVEELYAEQLILLKNNKEAIIDFLLDNIDAIRTEDLKIYEPVYKCYREKGHCHICKSTTNILCKNCNENSYHNNNEV